MGSSEAAGSVRTWAKLARQAIHPGFRDWRGRRSDGGPCRGRSSAEKGTAAFACARGHAELFQVGRDPLRFSFLRLRFFV